MMVSLHQKPKANCLLPPPPCRLHSGRNHLRLAADDEGGGLGRWERVSCSTAQLVCDPDAECNLPCRAAALPYHSHLTCHASDSSIPLGRLHRCSAATVTLLHLSAACLPGGRFYWQDRLAHAPLRRQGKARWVCTVQCMQWPRLWWPRPARHSAMPLSFPSLLLTACHCCGAHQTHVLRPAVRCAEGEGEGGEAAAESSKPKRGKAAKERKARAAAAGGSQGGVPWLACIQSTGPAHMSGC